MAAIHANKQEPFVDIIFIMGSGKSINKAGKISFSKAFELVESV